MRDQSLITATGLLRRSGAPLDSIAKFLEGALAALDERSGKKPDQRWTPIEIADFARGIVLNYERDGWPGETLITFYKRRLSRYVAGV